MNDIKSWSRLVTFAQSSVAVDAIGQSAIQLAQYLYCNLAAEASDGLQARYCLRADETGCLHLQRDQLTLYHGNDEALVADRLIGDTLYHLADKNSAGLLFHAAAVAWQGQGILLPGASGAGKSTLSAWLLSQGFRYMTDELVYLRQQAEPMQAFTRPLSLKAASRAVIGDFFDARNHDGQFLRSAQIDLIPATLFNCQTPLTSAPVQLIVLPQYRPRSQGEWRRLSAAQAGLALMRCLINARNLPDHGFYEVSALTKRVPAYAVTYSTFAQVREGLWGLVAS